MKKDVKDLIATHKEFVRTGKENEPNDGWKWD